MNRRYTNVYIYIKNMRAKKAVRREDRDYIQETNDVYVVGNRVKLCNW
jgi:hypothetical protein